MTQAGAASGRRGRRRVVHAEGTAASGLTRATGELAAWHM